MYILLNLLFYYAATGTQGAARRNTIIIPSFIIIVNPYSQKYNRGKTSKSQILFSQ